MATASAAAVCLGALLAACGSDSPDDEAYVAVGAVGASPERAPGRTVAPTGEVEMVPLEEEGDADGASGGGTTGEPGPGSGPGGDPDSAGEGDSGDGTPGASSGPAAPGGGETGADDGASPDDGAGSGDGASSGGGGNSGSGTGSSAEPSAPGEPSASPSGPAALAVVGEPVRKALDDRWCEKVTVKFRNSGGSPVRSGTVTFGTHIIGGLGVDWATIEAERKLPAPIAPGKAVTESWNLCVDAWRVPLGMHIETQDVSVKWK